MKKTSPQDIHLSVYRNNKYFHLLRFSTDINHSYVHFVSSYRKKVKTSDGVNCFYKKQPDHISYHQDGKIHIKHKDGSYHDLPFLFPENFLIHNKSYDFPWIAISFYDKAFDSHPNFFKQLPTKPDNHVIIKSFNVSFTVVLRVKDMAETPCAKRVIDFEVKIGGLIPAPPYSNLTENESSIEEINPILQVEINPNNELLNNLKLFGKHELKNVDNFHNYLTQTFTLT